MHLGDDDDDLIAALELSKNSLNNNSNANNSYNYSTAENNYNKKWSVIDDAIDMTQDSEDNDDQSGWGSPSSMTSLNSFSYSINSKQSQSRSNPSSSKVIDLVEPIFR